MSDEATKRVVAAYERLRSAAVEMAEASDEFMAATRSFPEIPDDEYMDAIRSFGAFREVVNRLPPLPEPADDGGRE